MGPSEAVAFDLQGMISGLHGRYQRVWASEAPHSEGRNPCLHSHQYLRGPHSQFTISHIRHSAAECQYFGCMMEALVVLQWDEDLTIARWIERTQEMALMQGVPMHGT